MKSGFKKSTLFFLLLISILSNRNFAEDIIIDDPLNHSTVGVVDGSGQFQEGGGWKSLGGKIVYDAGKIIVNGYFEATMRGWTAPTSTSGAGKSHPLSGWEIGDCYSRVTQTGSYWNLRIGSRYGTPERPYPFKVLAQPDSSSERVEKGLGNKDEVNDGNPHTYKIQWINGTVTVFFDGKALHSWSFHRFKIRYFTIGRDDWYGITDPAPIISDVKVVEISSADTVDKWKEKETQTSPSSREYHGMCYIGDDKVMLYGGASILYNRDTWVYDLSENRWEEKFPSGPTPSYRKNHILAYIGMDRALLFGGRGLDMNNETWVYDLSANRWTNMNPQGSIPSAREYHAMAYIGEDRVLLFGGRHEGIQDNETWLYDLSENRWTKMNPSTSPSVRDGVLLVYIGGDRVFLFSGNHYGQFPSDTWIYDLSENTWTEKYPTGQVPSGRGFLDGAYIGDYQVLIFGGFHQQYFDETYIYDLNKNSWEKIISVSSPSARVGHKIAETSLYGSRDIVLFGGENQGVYFNDTWIYEIGKEPVNEPPQFISETDVTAYEDSLFSYTAEAIDPDGSEVEYQFKDYPVWMSPSGRSISGTPSDGDQDTSFTVIASDTESSDTLVVSVTIIEVNDSPEIVNIKDFSFLNSESYAIDLDTCVVDHDHEASQLTWQITVENPNLDCQVSGHKATFLAGEWTGSSEIEFVVTDPLGGSDTATVVATISAPSDVDEQRGSVPVEFMLYQNSPNPFNPLTTISYDLPSSEQIRLVIFNTQGRVVRVLVDGFQQAGTHRLIWDGRDETGSELSSGIYLLKLICKDYSRVRKLILIR